MTNLIFLDLTTNLDHNSIKNIAIGASEYQAYNLIQTLSNYSEIVVYNLKSDYSLIDNISYKPMHDLIHDNIDSNSTIIIQRMLPNIKSEIYNKIKNNKIFLWIHDLIEMWVFMFNYNEVEKTSYYMNNKLFKNEIIREFYENKNIHFVFVSNFIKDKFKICFYNYGYDIEDSRLNVIYNILYEDEYINVKNQDIPINKNYITYASAWKKGIEHVVGVFDYAKSIDTDLKLVLLSPGYDWSNYTTYVNELKNKYGDGIIIHGPVNKERYSKIVKESLLVLTGTFQETFGCVFAESYYLGTPVLADYRSGAVKEIIDNNYIVNFDDKDAIFKKIIEIKNNRDNICVCLNSKFMLDENLNMWKQICRL
jgi:glycosyltransferase involved in cell wall biosynthesis